MRTIVFLILLAALASAQSVRLTWNTSTDPTVTGYHLWWASLNDQTVPLTKEDVGDVTQGVISGLAADQYYAFVTAYNAAGQDSDSSNEVVFTVPTPPAPVTIPVPATIATPPRGSFTTNQGTWSFGQWFANGFALLLNGVRVDNGLAAGALLFNSPTGIYTVNLQGTWYQWNGSKFMPIPAPSSL